MLKDLHDIIIVPDLQANNIKHRHALHLRGRLCCGHQYTSSLQKPELYIPMRGSLH